MSRRSRTLEILSAAQLAPQTLALEQARAEREGAQRASWLSLVKPLVDLGTGAVGAGIKSVEDNAEARASAALAGRAGDYGSTVAGPQVAGRAGPVYERSPAEQAAEEARELGPKPGNPLGFLLDPIERRVAERYRGARAAEIAQGRQGVEREAWGRDMQTRTLEATAAERQRQDALARDKLAADKAEAEARAKLERDKLAASKESEAADRKSRERIASGSQRRSDAAADVRQGNADRAADARERGIALRENAAYDKLHNRPLPKAAADNIATFNRALGLAQRIAEEKPNIDTGMLKGMLPDFLRSKEAVGFNSLAGSAINEEVHRLTGAAAGIAEMRRLMAVLPNPKKDNDIDFDVKLKEGTKSLVEAREEYLQSLEDSGFDVSAHRARLEAEGAAPSTGALDPLEASIIDGL